jgi:transposase
LDEKQLIARRRTPMNDQKYVALDVDSANIVAGVYDKKGESVMRTHMRTNRKDIEQFFKGLSGRVHVTFEEGTQAAWLYDVIKPLVREVTVCNPRRNKLLQSGSKGDRIDVEKLGKLLRLGEVEPVYQGEQTMLGLKHLVHGYECLVADTTRAMNRLKAVFRGRGIGCRGGAVYQNDEREEWLRKLEVEGIKARANYIYRELEELRKLRDEAEKSMCREARKQSVYKVIIKVPGLGPIRTAQIIVAVGSPHRFRTKRQFWAYCGLAVVSRSSADYEWVEGRVRRRNKPVQTRGLNKNFNRRLKAVFKGAGLTAMAKDKEFKQYYQQMIDKGIRPEMAQLTVARKIAAITLTVWKKGEKYDPERMNQAAQSTGNPVN